jgi:hypothetical protein
MRIPDLDGFFYFESVPKASEVMTKWQSDAAKCGTIIPIAVFC